MLKGTTKLLYPAIAEKTGSTKSKVERAIRTAVEKTWEMGNWSKLMEVFGNSYSSKKGKTTNSEFISGIVKYLSYQKG